MKKHIFRVWDNDHNKYFEPTYEALNGKLEDLHIGLKGDLFMRTVNETIHCDSVFPGRFEIEKATGLLDKYQKECFEGDIYRNNEAETVGVIHYQDTETGGRALWAAEKKNGELYNNLPFADMDITDFEIIGDIHQNPGMIK